MTLKIGHRIKRLKYWGLTTDFGSEIDLINTAFWRRQCSNFFLNLDFIFSDKLTSSKRQGQKERVFEREGRVY